MRISNRGFLVLGLLALVLAALLVRRSLVTRMAEDAAHKDALTLQNHTTPTGALARTPPAKSGTSPNSDSTPVGGSRSEGAGNRDDLLRRLGVITPEQLLYSIADLEAEPFTPEVLDKLERSLRELKSGRDKLRAAALLNRYVRSSGTEYLRSVLRDSPESAEARLAAPALAMSKDEASIPLLVSAFERCATDPEFAYAVGHWAHPLLIQKARSLMTDPSSPRTAMAMLLAMAGDDSGVEQLKGALQAAGGKNPARFGYEAAMVRFGEIPGDSLLARLHEAVQLPNPSLGGIVPEVLRLLGPERAVSIMEATINDYTARRKSFTREYEEYDDGVRAGTRSVGKDGPAYPRNEQTMIEAVSLLADWNSSSAVESIYQALEAAQGGVYVPLLNQTLIAALSELDPADSGSRLLKMGFKQPEIDAGFQISKLPPVPHLLKPQQKTIALSRRVRPDPPE